MRIIPPKEMARNGTEIVLAIGSSQGPSLFRLSWFLRVLTPGVPGSTLTWRLNFNDGTARSPIIVPSLNTAALSVSAGAQVFGSTGVSDVTLTVSRSEEVARVAALVAIEEL